MSAIINETIKETIQEEAAAAKRSFTFNMRPAQRSKNGAPRWAFKLRLNEEEEATAGHFTVVRAPRKKASLQMQQSAALRTAVRAGRSRLQSCGERFQPRFTLKMLQCEARESLTETPAAVLRRRHCVLALTL